MGYVFQSGEDAEEAIKRIAAEQSEKAIADLCGGDPDLAAFEARKRFKKIRALIRLSRSAISDKNYRHLNHRLAEFGRRLSDLRDARALHETLSRLMAHYQPQLDPRAFVEARAELTQRHGAIIDWARDNHVLFQTLAEEMGEAAAAIQSVKFREDGFDAFRGGLKRTYRLALSRFSDAYKHDDAEMFHDWRKPLKSLWLNLRLFKPVWDEGLEDFALCARALSDLTGEDHNLAILRDAALAEPAAFGGQGSAEALAGLTRVRGRELRNAAKPIAHGLFAGPPKAFVGKMEDYWDQL